MPTILAKFQEQRTEVPQGAARLTLSDYRADNDHNGLACPSCNQHIWMEHGDRLLCDCDMILETYGNSLRMWQCSGNEFPSIRKTYQSAGFYNLPVIARILHDVEIKDAYDNIPGVKDILDELNFLLKLHEDVDT